MHQDKVKYPIFSLIGTLMVVLAIGLGAYGAHGLEDAFSKTPRMEKAWGNAVDYQMFHGLALFILGILTIEQKKSKLWLLAGILITIGLILFCFSIYGWVFGGPQGLIMITPFGGFSFMFAWVLLAIHQFLNLKARSIRNGS